MKKTLLILTILLILAAPMRAQIFIMEEEENGRVENVFGNGEWNNIIIHGSPDDQMNYMPLGEGIMLLAALGGVYLMGKKRRKQDIESNKS